MSDLEKTFHEIKRVSAEMYVWYESDSYDCVVVSVLRDKPKSPHQNMPPHGEYWKVNVNGIGGALPPHALRAIADAADSFASTVSFGEHHDDLDALAVMH